MVVNLSYWKAWWAGFIEPDVQPIGRKPRYLVAWLSGAGQDVIRAFDYPSGIQSLQIELEPIPSSEDENFAQGVVAVSACNTMEIAACWTNGHVKFWKCPEGIEMSSLDTEMEVSEMSLAYDGTVLGLANETCAAFWNLQTGKSLFETREYQNISALSVNTSGSSVAIGYGAGSVAVLEPHTSQVLHNFQVPGFPDILSLSLSTKRDLLVASTTAGIVSIVDTKSGREVNSYRHPGQIDSVAYLEKSRTFASVSGGIDGDCRHFPVSVESV